MADKETVTVDIVTLLPTPVGCAMFLSDGDKVVLIYIDPSIGASMNDALSEVEPPRPQTHDFLNKILKGFGARMLSACIIDENEEVYYAVATFEIRNEALERKIVQVDCRPSDCLSMAIRQDVPIQFRKSVWESQSDSSGLLEDLKAQIEKLDG